MTLINKIKSIFKKDDQKKKISKVDLNRVSVFSIERKFEDDDLVGASKDLKILLEYFGTRKRKNHRYKGREFIYFILSNKHKELKNIGYTHWQNINQIIRLNHDKVYPYHKKNLDEAIKFFEDEIRGIKSIYVDL